MKKTITVADEIMATCHVVAKNIPATLDELNAKIEFLNVNEVPVCVSIGILEMKKLNAYINLRGKYVDFTNGSKSVPIILEPDRIIEHYRGHES